MPPRPFSEEIGSISISSTIGVVVLVIMFLLALGLVTLAEMSSPVLSLEAEQAQLSGQFTVGDDPLASGGQYVSVEAAGGHGKRFDGESVALLCFQIDEGGSYSIYADVLGTNEASNSFLVRLDYFDPWVWNFPRSKRYTYQAITSSDGEPVETELAAGQHVVGFHLNESGARLDTVDIVSVSGGHPKHCEGPSVTTAPVITSSTEAAESGSKPAKADRKPLTTSTRFSSSTPVTEVSTTTSMSLSTTAAFTTTLAPSTSSTTAASSTTTTVATASTTEGTTASGVVWSAGLESGSLSEWSYFSESSPGGSSASAEVASSPVRTGGYSMALTIEDSVKDTGIRAAVHGNDAIAGYSGAHNLPDDAYFSAWYYIPEHVSLANGDNWNVFQWKQTCQEDGKTTRCLLDWIKLVDLGDRYRFMLRSRTDDAGNWDPGISNTLGNNTDVTVRAGEWFHIESRRVYDTKFNGRITTWVNGELVWDVKGIRTEHGGSNWDWTTPVAGWRRQWTVNNYNTGGHSPDTHTLYVDDAKIALNRQGP